MPNPIMIPWNYVDWNAKTFECGIEFKPIRAEIDQMEMDDVP
jgi:hypothetical protein